MSTRMDLGTFLSTHGITAETYNQVRAQIREGALDPEKAFTALNEWSALRGANPRVSKLIAQLRAGEVKKTEPKEAKAPAKAKAPAQAPVSGMIPAAEARERVVAEIRKRVEPLRAELEAAKAELAAITAERDALKAELEALAADDEGEDESDGLDDLSTEELVALADKHGCRGRARKRETLIERIRAAAEEAPRAAAVEPPPVADSWGDLDALLDSI